MGGLSGTAAAVSPTRRWLADPLLLLGLLGVAAAVLAVAQRAGAVQPAWPVPALLAVVAAGLALSGST